MTANDAATATATAGEAFRFRGPIRALDGDALRALLDRSTASEPAIRARTTEIVSRVRSGGDAALRELARELDSVSLDVLEVPRERWRQALDALDDTLRGALKRAARNVATAHRAFLPQPVEVETEPGVVVGRRPDPLARVGVYAPGGRAAYPSSLLMGAIPAKLAGVPEVIVCSPPGPDGTPADVVLAAAELAGVDRCFAIGGAGAVAAMAYGTESIPRVDRIVGPGNAWVAEAKLQCATVVGIDAPAGPSELLVIADPSSDPVVVARELLAQAEHDPMAAVVAVVVGEETALEIEAAVLRFLPAHPRRDIVAQALLRNGGLLLADDHSHAVAFANAYAPEHLLLAVADADAPGLLERVRNAGTVFVGETSSVAFGDYLTGGNHVLPTGGLARTYSGLSTADFVRWTTWQRVTREAAARLAGDVAALAESEGLPGHADAARQWRGA